MASSNIINKYIIVHQDGLQCRRNWNNSQYFICLQLTLLNKDDSDEYLQKRRDAVSKAIKSTKEGLDKKPTKRLSDVGGVVGIPALGDMIKGK